MSIASRHGKLYVDASDDEKRWTRMEDLLTADVFGAFRYLPPELGLLPFLSMAVTPDGTSLPAWAARQGIEWSALTRADLVFWPAFGSREPDLLVGLGTEAGGVELLVLVEAKLHAQQHWIEGVSQLGYYGRRLLGGELDDDLLEVEPPPHRPVILLTKATEAPRAELEQARTELREHIEEERTDVFWLSWHHARATVSDALAERESSGGPPHVLALLGDLLEDLAERGFAPLRGRLTWPLVLPDPLEARVESHLRLWSFTPSRGEAGLMNLHLERLPVLDTALREWSLR